MTAHSMQVGSAAAVPAAVTQASRRARDETNTMSMQSTCRFCGHENFGGAKFCNECGAQLELQPCSACDAVNAVGDMTCHACGALLLDEPDTKGLDVADAKLAELRFEVDANHVVRMKRTDREPASGGKPSSPERREAHGQARWANALGRRGTLMLALLTLSGLTVAFGLKCLFVDGSRSRDSASVAPVQKISGAPAVQPSIERPPEAEHAMRPDASPLGKSGMDNEGESKKELQVGGVASSMDAKLPAQAPNSEELPSQKPEPSSTAKAASTSATASNSGTRTSSLGATLNADARTLARAARKAVAARRVERAGAAKPSSSPREAEAARPLSAIPEAVLSPPPTRASPARAEPKEECPSAWTLAGCIPGA